MIPYTLEHIFSFNVTLAPPELIGPAPEGVRVNLPITGGEVQGPKLRGRIRPCGGDWFIVRTDGVGLLDVRATIETHDGALVYLTYSGVLDPGTDGYQQILRGEPIPSGLPIRTAPRCSTSHPDYLWLNRVQCVGVGQAFVERSEVIYDVYALR